MAKLVYGLNQSLTANVDHMKVGPPHPSVFHHFIEHGRSLTGAVYGRTTYEIMRYWDDDLPDWDADACEQPERLLEDTLAHGYNLQRE